MKRADQAVVAISGVKNSGKTTLIEALLPKLTAQGLKVAVIKHDGHDFSPDVPGTDTFRHRQAGAYGAAVFSAGQWMASKAVPVTEAELLALFPEADLILLEGFKHSPWPKLELVRQGNSEESVCEVSTLLGLVTDLPLTAGDAPVYSPADLDGIAALLCDYTKRTTRHAGPF